MRWGSNPRAANPIVVKSLLGVAGFGLFVLALFAQPWVPIEIGTPETGVLVAMPSPFPNPSPTAVAPSPKDSQPVDVPVAPPPESTSLPAAPVVQTAEVSAIPAPPVQEPPGQRVLGKPTVVYQLPKAFEVPASEEGLQWTFVIPTGVERDLYLTGADLRPGNKALVKRMTLSFDPTGTARVQDKESPQPGFASETFGRPDPSIVLAEWSPGMSASPLPKGTGYHIPKGADLVLTVDYAASPVSAPDPWQMGLHITRTPPEHLLGRIEIFVPPSPELQSTAHLNDMERKRQAASYKLPVAITMYSIHAASYFDGHGMRAFAVLPSGENIPLLHFEKWDANSRDRCYFQDPVSLPQDSRIVVETWGNNDVEDRIIDRATLRCELEVTTPDAAHLEPLMRHNQAAFGQP